MEQMREYIKNPCRRLSPPAASCVCLEWKCSGSAADFALLWCACYFSKKRAK